MESNTLSVWQAGAAALQRASEGSTHRERGASPAPQRCCDSAPGAVQGSFNYRSESIIIRQFCVGSVVASICSNVSNDALAICVKEVNEGCALLPICTVSLMRLLDV